MIKTVAVSDCDINFEAWLVFLLVACFSKFFLTFLKSRNSINGFPKAGWYVQNIAYEPHLPGGVSLCADVADIITFAIAVLAAELLLTDCRFCHKYCHLAIQLVTAEDSRCTLGAT